MYSARDRLENQRWLDQIADATETLGLGEKTRHTAEELFLTHLPDSNRSKPAVAAAALYAATLIAGEERSQRSVADAMDVTRLSVQSRWKPILRDAGYDPPTW